MKYKDFFKYLFESHWVGWDHATRESRNELIDVLINYKSHITKTYSKSLATPILIKLDKLIDEISYESPEEASKIFSRFSSDERLNIYDYVTRHDNSAIDAMDVIYNRSHHHMVPIKSKKPDIILQNLAKFNNGSNGDVSLFSLEDMTPKIGFGIGTYDFDDEFIKQFNKPNAVLMLDIGRGFGVINIQHVIQTALEKIKEYNSLH